MNPEIEQMLKALTPERKSVEISGYTFYARPMTLKEFHEHIYNPDKEHRDEIAILRCIEDEAGKPVFESLDQVRALYTNVRQMLFGLVAMGVMFDEPHEIEKEVKNAPR